MYMYDKGVYFVSICILELFWRCCIAFKFSFYSINKIGA